MSRTAVEVLKGIAAFEPRDQIWLGLENLLAELWVSGPPPREALPVLFGVFERFPAEDGAGVFWSIVHGVESLPYSYAEELRASMQRVPSQMGSIMLGRLALPGGAG